MIAVYVILVWFMGAIYEMFFMFPNFFNSF